MRPPDANQKLVSVIMPTYNQDDFISSAIESVLNQSYSNFELIIVDNYSEDDTEKIVASYWNNRIKYLKFKNNGIIAASRNFGVKNACGEYLAFLDSDDKWRKEKLEKQIPHFQNDFIVGVGSDIIYESIPKYKNTSLGKDKKGFRDYCYYDLLLNNPVAASSVVVRKTDFLSVGGFDEDTDFKYIEDWELWLRLARKGNFRIIHNPPITYRIYPTTRDKIDVTKKKLKVINKHYKLGYITKREMKEPEANIYFYLACKLFVPDNKASKEYFSKAFTTSNVIKTKIKVSVGLLLNMQPIVLRRIMFNILHRANRSSRYL